MNSKPDLFHNPHRGRANSFWTNLHPSPTTQERPFFVRVFKIILTVYLLLSIFYATTISIIKPVFLKIVHMNDFLKPVSSAGKLPAAAPVNFEIIPRLLPGEAHFQPLGDVRIRTNLKGTLVNTREVMAEDEASVWSSKPVAVSSSNSLISSESTIRSSATESVIPPRTSLKNFDPLLFNDTITWHPPQHELANTPSALKSLLFSGSVRSTELFTSEDFFLSKAFGDSLGPNKIVPFYYKALGPDGNGNIDKRDISITTLVTSNRLKVFSQLVEVYRGPISATIHVSDSPEILKPLLDDLDAMYRTSPSMSTWVDIHLVVDSFDRQFNMWRNVAKFFARTELVMMLDVDFWPCTDFRKRILSSKTLMDQVLKGSFALVIPAFEFTKQSDGVDATKFPTTKTDLMKLVNEGKIGMFHRSWRPGHGSTNYERFYQTKGDGDSEEVYKISNYTHSYEPYVVYKKEGTPFCDERFIGYGGNKAACLYELYLSGVSFYVLPQDFLIHKSHPYAEKTRKHERKFNRKLYADFREEVCFRYLMELFDKAETEVARNMLHECHKIKGFSTAASRLSESYDVKLDL